MTSDGVPPVALDPAADDVDSVRGEHWRSRDGDTTLPRRRLVAWAILAIFLLSGAAGLVYEVVWSRQLVLVFGNTTEATSTILTGFFAGMAIGALAGGRLADRVASPLRLYGVLELGTAAVVLLTPLLFRAIAEVYRGAFGSLESVPQLLALVRFALALVALGPATVMLGATLPALTRHLRASGTLADAFGRLYAANTIGAILGTVAAGFVLIELLGLSGALIAGVAGSTVAGVLALLLSLAWPPERPTSASRAAAGPILPLGAAPPSDAADPAAETAVPREPGRARSAPLPRKGGTRAGRRDARGLLVGPDEPSAAAPRLALAIAFISGLTSLGYQVLWNRMLGEGTGGSTYVFTVILATFLVGLALGAVLFSLVRPHVRDLSGLIALTQAGVAILAIAGLVLVIVHPQSMPVSSSRIDTLLSILARRALLVVFPTTILLGFCFPAASALLADREGETAREAGTLLAVNTAGSITGTFVIPFLLVPVIGSARALVLLAAANASVAVALGAWRASRLVSARFATLAGGVAAVVIVGSVVSGSIVSPAVALAQSRGAVIFSAREDQIASVVAGSIGGSPRLWVGGTSMTALTIDTKLMPVLAVALRPQARTALVVAFGMGSAFRNSLLEGLHTDAVELVPSVPKDFGFFYPDAPRVLANPNGRVIIADGRNHLDLTSDRYDVILVDPPPPIQTAGVSVIASLEFYQSGAAHLTPTGTMMEWVPFGETVPEFQAIVRTFASAFPHVMIIKGPGGNGFFMFGSAAPLDLTADNLRAALDRPGVVQDLSSAYDAKAKTLDGWVSLLPGQVWLRDAQVMRYAGTGPLVTDDKPLPEYFLLRHTFQPAPYLGYSLPGPIGSP